MRWTKISCGIFLKDSNYLLHVSTLAKGEWGLGLSSRRGGCGHDIVVSGVRRNKVEKKAKSEVLYRRNDNFKIGNFHQTGAGSTSA